MTVEMSPNAKQKLAKDVGFDIDMLLATLRQDLELRQLIASDGDYDLKVMINDVRVRDTASAVLLGFLAGDDHLIGQPRQQPRSDQRGAVSEGKRAAALFARSTQTEGAVAADPIDEPS